MVIDLREMIEDMPPDLPAVEAEEMRALMTENIVRLENLLQSGNHADLTRELKRFRAQATHFQVIFERLAGDCED